MDGIQQEQRYTEKQRTDVPETKSIQPMCDDSNDIWKPNLGHHQENARKIASHPKKYGKGYGRNQ